MYISHISTNISCREKYFDPEIPNSGLFISYPKLLNSYQPPLNQISTGDRITSVNNGAPHLRAPQTPVSSSHSQLMAPSSLPTGIARHKLTHSGSLSGPRRTSTPPQIALPLVSNPFARPKSHILRPEQAFPSLHDSKTTPKSPMLRRTSGTWPVEAVFGESDASAIDIAISKKSFNSARYQDHSSGSNSAAVAQAVAMAVSQVQTEAQMKIHDLQQQLGMTQNELKERDYQLQEQMGLLRDLESTVVEFQALKEEEDVEREASAEKQNPSVLEEIKKNHQRELEERDRKITNMRAQLDQRRSDFRETLDTLQLDMQESNSAYVREIQTLQTQLLEAKGIAERVPALEQYVRDMESLGGSGHQNKGADQEARAHITKLAELENKLLEKDQKLHGMKEQLEQALQRVQDISYPSSAPSEEQTKETLIINEQLKDQLKAEQKQRITLENEISKLESIIEQKASREQELEREVEVLKQNRNNPPESSSHTRNVSTSTTDLVSISRENLFSTTSGRETPITPPRIDTLLEALPIHSPKLILPAVTIITSSDEKSINRSPALPPGALSPSSSTAISIVSVITAAAQQHSKSTTTAAATAAATIATSPLTHKSRLSSSASTFKALTETVLPVFNSPSFSKKKLVEVDREQEKWCGLCERSGHGSLECPFEEEF